MPLKILHTADVHLGARFLRLGPRGQEQRSQLFQTFSRTVELALAEEVDLFLVAGDLVESNQAPASLVARVASCLQQLTSAGIQVLISPGTHDSYGEGSVYQRPPFRGMGGLTVFTDEKMRAHPLPEHDCTVYGNANTTPFRNRYPLSDLEPCDSRWRIGMLHTSFEIPDITGDTYLVTGAQIASSRLHYLAMGHYHSLLDHSSGGVTAYYPGSPELVRLQKGDFGYVLLVELGDGVRVEPLKVGRRKYEEVVLQAEGLTSRVLESALEKQEDPNTVLKVKIEGLRRPGYPDVEEIVGEFRGRFFHLECDDRSRPAPSALEPGCYPQGSAAASYLEIMSEVLKTASASESEEVLEAMQLGLSLLEQEED